MEVRVYETDDNDKFTHIAISENRVANHYGTDLASAIRMYSEGTWKFKSNSSYHTTYTTETPVFVYSEETHPELFI